MSLFKDAQCQLVSQSLVVQLVQSITAEHLNQQSSTWQHGDWM